MYRLVSWVQTRKTWLQRGEGGLLTNSIVATPPPHSLSPSPPPPPPSHLSPTLLWKVPLWQNRRNFWELLKVRSTHQLIFCEDRCLDCSMLQVEANVRILLLFHYPPNSVSLYCTMYILSKRLIKNNSTRLIDSVLQYNCIEKNTSIISRAFRYSGTVPCSLWLQGRGGPMPLKGLSSEI